MDGLKLEKWREGFNEEAQQLQTKLQGILNGKQLKEYYQLKVEETTQTLQLEFPEEGLPEEVKQQLESLLVTTTPEDSV